MNTYNTVYQAELHAIMEGTSHIVTTLKPKKQNNTDLL